jgi:hypothetical protein
MSSDPGKTGAELPFAQMMGQAKNAAEEFTKMFATLKLPALPASGRRLGVHAGLFRPAAGCARAARRADCPTG